MPNPSHSDLVLGTYDSGPRAGDIGYPKWHLVILSEITPPPGPSFEGIE